MPSSLRLAGLASILGVVAVVAVVAACGTPAGGQGTATTTRAQPWPQRPVVELTFDVADDLASVTGRESVVLTPDAQVCELVFRAWPNKPTAAAGGSSLRVTDAVVDGGPVTPVVTAAGAPPGSPGTLVTLPLSQCADAGTPVRAELGFSLVLGQDAGERVGYAPSAGVAWFGTAFPLLAWVRGAGWVRDPAVGMAGETVVSEDFRLAALAVTAPSVDRVLGTGSVAGVEPGPRPGTTSHRFTADAVRDVAVSVGRFTVVEREAGGVRYHVGVPEGSRVDGGGWADALEEQTAALQDLLGPYPYPDVWASVLPPLDDGIEFPSALQFGDVGPGRVPALVAHELAHQWFYALVGNDQARDPWIDEAFATYAQARVTGQVDSYRLTGDRGQVGRPMEYWARRGDFDRYVRGVYDQGAAVLLEGRRRSGADRFDAALRAYLDTNAHRVVAPGDVAAAFDDLPETMSLLREYGALPAT